MIAGAEFADSGYGSNSGAAYVIFGRESDRTIDLENHGAPEDFRIDGASAGDREGRTVSGAGDVNGDGIPDVEVGAPGDGNNGFGSAYVVFGKDTTGTVNLDNFGEMGNEEGFRIDGAANGYETSSVSSAGNFNDDDRPDIIVGAPRADNNGRTDSGSAYIIYGFWLVRG